MNTHQATYEASLQRFEQRMADRLSSFAELEAKSADRASVMADRAIASADKVAKAAENMNTASDRMATSRWWQTAVILGGLGIYTSIIIAAVGWIVN